MEGTNKTNELKRDSGILIWLYSGCFLIFAMVIIGGITRLTGSGLSITEWKVITGTLPPLSEAAWIAEFEAYKQSPQFQRINSHFQLSDFQQIYWWEYIHRLVARILGLVFIFPLIYFIVKKRINKALAPKLGVIFLLGAWQGVLGWLMVASGLQSNPHVSHINLATHLVNAFILFGYIYWVTLDLQYTNDSLTSYRPKREAMKFSWILLALFAIQLTYGAFVAGLRAGNIFNTWPLMDGQVIADSVFIAFEKTGFASLVNNHATVQFIHRTVAIIFLLAVVYFWYNRNTSAFSLKGEQKNAINILLIVTLLQVLLGITTLLLYVPLILGVVHQAMAFVLFGLLIFIWHRLKFA
ncbi:MAG: COX15/CtaA family protein [Bacteroidetes bacterium]|nr:COX15/CtaA family protein [Bacteroidota bacterium]